MLHGAALTRKAGAWRSLWVNVTGAGIHVYKYVYLPPGAEWRAETDAHYSNAPFGACPLSSHFRNWRLLAETHTHTQAKLTVDYTMCGL